MAQENRFWDRHAAGYAKRPVADEDAYRKKLRVTQEYLGEDMEVLEFGCGTGTTALIHAPYVKHIRAVDFSRNMIDIARAKADAQGVTNVTFEQAGIDDLACAGASYDVVMGHSILHLLDNWRDVVATVHAMLKPGGVFVTSTACLKGKMPLLRVIVPIGHFLGLLPQVQFISGDELSQCLTDTGFTVAYRWDPDDKVVFLVARKDG